MCIRSTTQQPADVPIVGVPGSQGNGLQAGIVVGRTGRDVLIQARHLHLHLLLAQAHRGQHHHLVPGHAQRQAQRRVGIATELEHNGPTAIDHQIEPAVVAGHREALVGAVRRYAHANEAHAVGCDHFAAHHGRSAANRERKTVQKSKKKV